MEASQLGQGRGRGSIILKMLGLAVFAVGLHWLLGILAVVFPILRHVPIPRGLTGQAYVLGIWLLQGTTAELASAALGVLYLFAAFQLLRLRRSGWVVTTLLLGYASLSIALWWVTGQLEKAVRAAQDPRLVDMVESLGARLSSPMEAAGIERGYRLAGFFFVLYCVPLLYLTTEWRRFWKRGEREEGRFGSWWKALVGVPVLVASAAWAFWGAEYAHYRRVLNEAASPTPKLAAERIDYLSPIHRRQVTAMLVRRLTAERTDASAEAILSFFGPLDLSLLTAEDIAPLIAAARNPDPKVREACSELLSPIGTPEAEECLMEAVNGPQDEAWSSALGALARMKPSRAPEVLLELAKQEGEERRYIVFRLRDFGDPRVLPVLLAAMGDEDPVIRSMAEGGLSGHPGQAAERALLDALGDRETAVRSGACWDLGEIGTAESVTPLIGALKSAGGAPELGHDASESSLRTGAARALKLVTGKDFGEDAAQWERWWREAEADFDMERNLAARLFTPLPPLPEHPFESRAREESAPYHNALNAQSSAVHVIESRDLRALAPELARYLRMPFDQAPVQPFAARVLADWGYREGIEWLIGSLDDDSDPGGPMFAISTLGRACKVNFFSEKKRWRQWWEANENRFPAAVTAPE